MSFIATFKKQPDERKDYDILFDEWLRWDEEDTLDDVTAKVSIISGPSEELLVVERIDISSTVAKLWISGGQDGATYKIEVTTATQRGRIDQSEIKFIVKEN